MIFGKKAASISGGLYCWGGSNSGNMVHCICKSKITCQNQSFCIGGLVHVNSGVSVEALVGTKLLCTSMAWPGYEKLELVSQGTLTI